MRLPAGHAGDREHQGRAVQAAERRRERGQGQVDVRRRQVASTAWRMASYAGGAENAANSAAAQDRQPDRADGRNRGSARPWAMRALGPPPRRRRARASAMKRSTTRRHAAVQRPGQRRAGPAGRRGEKRRAGRGGHPRREGRGVQFMVGEQDEAPADEIGALRAAAPCLGDPVVDRSGSRPRPAYGVPPPRRVRLAPASESTSAPGVRPAIGGSARRPLGEGREHAPARGATLPSRHCGRCFRKRAPSPHAHSSRATSSSRAEPARATASWPRYQSFPCAIVAIAEANTGSPQAIASSAIAALRRPRDLRCARRATSAAR